MNRKQFLKRLGIGVGVAVVTPTVLANIKTEEPLWDKASAEAEFQSAEEYHLDKCREIYGHFQPKLRRSGFETYKVGDLDYAKNVILNQPIAFSHEEAWEDLVNHGVSIMKL